MENVKSVSTPLATSPKITIRTCTLLADGMEYHKVVGSLQYLAFTRPDIAYDINKLSIHAFTNR